MPVIHLNSLQSSCELSDWDIIVFGKPEFIETGPRMLIQPLAIRVRLVYDNITLAQLYENTALAELYARAYEPPPSSNDDSSQLLSTPCPSEKSSTLTCRVARPKRGISLPTSDTSIPASESSPTSSTAMRSLQEDQMISNSEEAIRTTRSSSVTQDSQPSPSSTSHCSSPSPSDEGTNVNLNNRLEELGRTIRDLQDLTQAMNANLTALMGPRRNMRSEDAFRLNDYTASNHADISITHWWWIILQAFVTYLITAWTLFL
jgi:hypothetical protein